MRKLLPLLCVASALTFSACNNEPEGPISEQKQEKGKTLPQSNGGRLDLLVVAEDAVWDGIAGDYVRKYFTTPQYGLPQPEPVFTLRQVNPKEFNTLLQHARNLIVLEKQSDSSYRVAQNVFAKPQLMAAFTGTEKQMAQSMAKVHTELYNTFYAAEIDVMLQRLQPARMEELPDMLTNMGVRDMVINRAFEVEHEHDSLLVMWNKTVKSDQGIIVYTRPMRENEIVESSILATRDSLVKQYIPGEREGSYMITESILPPEVTPTTIDGMLAFEMRGLWRTRGDFKGGPFVNYTILDEKNQRVIMLEAFVFAPEIKKRNLLFELECMLRSFTLK
jgi:hypothetical protein